MSRLRITVRIPRSTQTTPESWQDSSYDRSFEVECPDELAELMLRDAPAGIVAVELVP